MRPKQLALLVFFSLCISCHYASKVWLYNCGKNGFTCRAVNKRSFVIYQCPKQNEKYQFNINEFNGPANIESLIIKNCKKLTVNFRCTTYRSEKKNLKYLEISNIETLKIEQLPIYHSQLPPTVVLENITLIESIPGHSFAQIHARRNKKCILPKSHFHSISFRNVVVNDVQSNAFQMPNAFGNVAFINSRINNFHTSSMRAILSKNGVFLMRGSAVENFHPSAISLAGNSVIFEENRFANISPSGINATTETFYFRNNSVNTLTSHALSIRSTKTVISNNNLGWMGTGALKNIGPRLSRSLCSYEFIGNVVNFTNASSLLPNVDAYQNLSSILFKKNTLPCGCHGAGWLLNTLNVIATPQDSFYNMVTSDKFENMCSSSCNLPISIAHSQVLPNQCLENDIIEKLCQNMNKPQTVSNVALTTPNIINRTYDSNIPTTANISTTKRIEEVPTATTGTILNNTSYIPTTDASTTIITATKSQSTQSEDIGEVSRSIKVTSNTNSNTVSLKSTTVKRETTNALRLTPTVTSVTEIFEIGTTGADRTVTETALELTSASYSQVCSVYLIGVLFSMLYLPL